MVQDTNDPLKDALQETGRPSAGESQESSDKVSPDVFTTEEMWAFANFAAGKRHSELAKQIDQGSKWANLASIELGQTKANIDALQQELNDKQADNPELADVEKLKRELRGERAKLEQDRASLTWSQLENQELIERAEKQALAETAKQIAEEFSVNSEALLDQPTPDAMRTLAQKLADAAAAAKPAPTKPDSGSGTGGRDLSSMTADERLREGFRQLKK